jgi:histone H3/H4
MSTKIPRDALVIQAILKDMGITEYEPRVINQLLEFIYRKPRNSKIERLNDFSLTVLILGYVTTVLDDAKAYANHAKKKGIDLDDVKLAVSMQMEQSFTSPPPREVYRIYYRNKLFGHILIYFTFRFSWKLQDQKIAHLYLQ